MMTQSVLFLCTGNSARSQMAEGLLRHLAGDKYQVQSGGTNPVGVNPFAVEVMREIGIDISGHTSKNVTDFLGAHFTHIITVCDNARERCPVFPGVAQRLHWPFQDPAAAKGDETARRNAFRSVRDEIRAKIEEFLRT